MTPREVLDLPVAYVADSVDASFNYREPWPGLADIDCGAVAGKQIPGVEVRVHGEAWGDYRRFWRVFSIWVDGRPAAIGRHAGREGDDSCDKWVLDRASYAEFVRRVLAALPHYEGGEAEVAMDDDLGDVLRWYGEGVEPGKKTTLGWGCW